MTSLLSNFSFLPQYWKLYLDGVVVTLELSVISIILGAILGAALTGMHASRFKLFSLIARTYIGIIRDTPLLVQVYVVYIGLPEITGFKIPDFMTGVIALTICSSAYISEVFRAGIDSVPSPQIEAARGLGMSRFQTARGIILPQALKNIMPALVNQFITNIKSSSLVSVLGIGDLMYEAQTVRGSTALGIQPILVAAVIYLVIMIVMNTLLGRLEKRLKKNDHREASV